jgi:hypothetical protein
MASGGGPTIPRHVPERIAVFPGIERIAAEAPDANG